MVCSVTKGFVFGLSTAAKDIFLFTRAGAIEFSVEWNVFDNIRSVFHKADGLLITIHVMQVLAIHRHAQGPDGHAFITERIPSRRPFSG